MEYLILLLLPTGKALIDGASFELVRQVKERPFFFHELEKLRGRQGGQSFVSAFGVHGGFHKIGHGDPRNLYGILEGEKNPFPGALFGRHGEQILAFKEYLSACNCIGRIAGKNTGEGGFAGTVRSHNSVHLTLIDEQVDAFQNLFIAYRGVEINYS